MLSLYLPHIVVGVGLLAMMPFLPRHTRRRF